MVAFLPLLSSTALAFYSPPTAYGLPSRSAIVRMDEVGVAEPAATEVDTTTKGVVVPTKSGDGLPAIGAVNRFDDEYADLFKTAAMKSAPPSNGGAMSDENGCFPGESRGYQPPNRPDVNWQIMQEEKLKLDELKQQNRKLRQAVTSMATGLWIGVFSFDPFADAPRAAARYEILCSC